MSLFALERRNAAGLLLAITWAVVPEEEPAAQARFIAALLHQDFDGVDKQEQ